MGDEDPVWDATAYYLAGICVTLILVASPERIVFGGGVMELQLRGAAAIAAFAAGGGGGGGGGVVLPPPENCCIYSPAKCCREMEQLFRTLLQIGWPTRSKDSALRKINAAGNETVGAVPEDPGPGMTLPLLCCSTAFAAKTLPFPCVFCCLAVLRCSGNSTAICRSMPSHRARSTRCSPILLPRRTQPSSTLRRGEVDQPTAFHH